MADQIATELPRDRPDSSRLQVRGKLRDGWLGLRNRLLASSRFQRLSGRFPLTRPIARKRAQALFDLCSGFVYSQVLYACVELRLLEAVKKRPCGRAELARMLALEPDRAKLLFDAAAALELLEERGGEAYGLGPLGAVLVGNPGIRALIGHHAMFYEDLRDPIALLRGEAGTTRLADYWPYAGGPSGAGAAADLSADRVGAYSELMAQSQNLIAGEVLDAYSLRHHRLLLDVGGGAGAFLAAAAARWPRLRLQLFDLPAVVGRAEQFMAAAGLASRFESRGGDFFADPLPSGADIVSLVRIIHDHGDGDVLHLLRSIRGILPGDGALLLAEPMAGDKATDRMARAYFGFYLLAMGKGRPRTPDEIGALLRRAGFSEVRLLANRMPMQTRIMVAKP